MEGEKTLLEIVICCGLSGRVSTMSNPECIIGAEPSIRIWAASKQHEGYIRSYLEKRCIHTLLVLPLWQN
jgi:hypothetical protein